MRDDQTAAVSGGYRFLSWRHGAVTALAGWGVRDQAGEALPRHEVRELIGDLGRNDERYKLVELAHLLGAVDRQTIITRSTLEVAAAVLQAVNDDRLVVYRGWPRPADGPPVASRVPAAPEPTSPRIGAAPRPDSPGKRRIELVHQYHDDEPVHGAAYRVRLADGSVRDGKLDSAGRAVIEDVPDGPASVQLGPDARSYELINRDQNPDYKSTLTAADLDALIEQAQAAATG